MYRIVKNINKLNKKLNKNHSQNYYIQNINKDKIINISDIHKYDIIGDNNSIIVNKYENNKFYGI